MIKTGQKFTFFKGDGSPLSSPNTHLAAAIIASGGSLAPDGFRDTVGENADGTPRRTAVWMFQEKPLRFFLTDGTTEEISTSEFTRRWNDLEWIAANSDHPIAFMRAYQIQLSGLRDHIKKTPPLVEIRKGGRFAQINPNEPKEKTDKLLAYFQR